MCEKCEEQERLKKMNCQICSTSLIPSEIKIEKVNRIAEVNRVATREDEKIIEEQLKKQHRDLIDGYDKQFGDALTELATFSTKMLIMYNDYLKKGESDEMSKLLRAINNYALMSGVNSALITTTISILIEKIHAHGKS